MAKIIFTSRFVRDAPPAQLENYVQYIGTREGVEKIDESKRYFPVTAAQKKLIRQILKDMPDTKDMLEYEDYEAQATIGNASEFITCALEQHLDIAAMKENYVDYVANRPRVERIGEHGLFTDAGDPVILSKVKEEVATHQGPVWTHVVSLRREDAKRLGYDSGKEWMSLLRSKRAMLSKYMKIDSENLKWYAAFHNEGHHPHVHIMVYSKKDNDGYLTKAGIEAMRSELAHSIFRQDFAQIYEGQKETRSQVKEEVASRMKEMVSELSQGVSTNRSVAEKLLLLSKRLANTGGKKVYGYLKADVKAIIDQIVEELARDPKIQEAYEVWGRWQNEIRMTYASTPARLLPLSQQKAFKSIKNMVIAEALSLNGDSDYLEAWKLFDEKYDEELDEDIEELEQIPGDDEEGYAQWNETYQMARQYLYGTEGREKDYIKAFSLFTLEAEKGNAYACYALGRLYASGLGVEQDLTLSEEWYAKALAVLQFTEQRCPEREKPYLQYRIGKMYAAGLGTKQDYAHAAEWFQKAVQCNHKYAKYSLAGLYRRGQGVELDEQKAFALYQLSAEQGNAYACYEAAKMLCAGIGTEVSLEKAEGYFTRAFCGFRFMESNSHDDKLQYRLGQMLYQGIGTKADPMRAVQYWMEAVKMEHKQAKYALAKHWLMHGNGDMQKAVQWMEEEADTGNDYAAYLLGKTFVTGQFVEQNLAMGVYWLTKAAEAGNPYAQYFLEHMNEEPSYPNVFLAATKLLRQLEALFREEFKEAAGGSNLLVDRKQRRKTKEKKIAQGHKEDDREPEQKVHG